MNNINRNMKLDYRIFLINYKISLINNSIINLKNQLKELNSQKYYTNDIIFENNKKLLNSLIEFYREKRLFFTNKLGEYFSNISSIDKNTENKFLVNWQHEIDFALSNNAPFSFSCENLNEEIKPKKLLKI